MNLRKVIPRSPRRDRPQNTHIYTIAHGDVYKRLTGNAFLNLGGGINIGDLYTKTSKTCLPGIMLTINSIGLRFTVKSLGSCFNI